MRQAAAHELGARCERVADELERDFVRRDQHEAELREALAAREEEWAAEWARQLEARAVDEQRQLEAAVAAVWGEYAQQVMRPTRRLLTADLP